MNKLSIVRIDRMVWAALVIRASLPSLKRLVICLFAGLTSLGAQKPTPSPAPDSRMVRLPMNRDTYFVGESVLVNAIAEPGQNRVKVELTDASGKVAPLYEGAPGSWVLDTAKLAPGTYTLGGVPFHLVPVVRSSVASLQDEGAPKFSPNVRAETIHALTETGLTAVMGALQARAYNPTDLNSLAGNSVLYFNNPETRPMSFLTVKEDPVERIGMAQRMLQSAQQHGQFPNFSGFVYGFGSIGFAPGGRRMLMVYWSWQGKADSLRKYTDRQDELVFAEFKKQTGLDWVQPKEYLAYMFSLGRSDLVPIIDLPTVRWVEGIAAKMKAMPEAEKVAFEKRLDAWSAYLMTFYEKNYTFFQESIQEFDPTFKNTSCVQIDHAPLRVGQSMASANRPLDFRYQSTWNDQIDKPDYLFQPLFVGGVLNMDRPDDKRVWISATLGPVHGRASHAGKLTRAAAHNLANGVSGIGFALEGFSSLFTLNHFKGWKGARDTAIGFDALSGKDFLDRFAWLAVEGRGDYGAGVLVSETQLGRQDVIQGFGAPQFNAFITLARLGYTPVYLTEKEIAAKRYRGVKSLVIPGQVVPLPTEVISGLRDFIAQGGRVFADQATTTEVAATDTLDFAMPFRLEPGKAHNYQSPNQSPNQLWPAMYAEYAPVFDQGLKGIGHAVLTPAGGIQSDVTLSQISGGADAKYVVAVNDSMVATQSDWRQVTERLIPNENTTGFLYDLTEEKALGPLAAFECDLRETTARVYAILPREMGAADLKATQKITAGSSLGLSLGFKDKEGRPLAGVLPFHLTVKQPDGAIYFAGYRGTDMAGKFSMALDVPVNRPDGQWSVEVRSQLDGSVTTLPVTVAAGKNAGLARPLKDEVLVREKHVIERTLTKGQTVLLPLFGAQVTDLTEVAKHVQQTLATRGVTVKILENPELVEYTVDYDPTPEQLAQNARVDRGEAIGQVKSHSINGNDWMGSNRIQSRYPLIVLVTSGGSHPVAQALKEQRWPKLTDTAPAVAVVQGVAWAFGSGEANAVVIEARDAQGIRTATQQLTNLPTDFLTQSVRATRSRLLSEFHLGGTPARAPEKGLTQTGLAIGKPSPQPFRIPFGESRPLAAGAPPASTVTPQEPLAIPGVAAPGKLFPMLRFKDDYVNASHPRAWSQDLRFSDATDLEIEVPQAGPVEIVVDGIFRYSDRRPATQPQWEDYLILWDQYLKAPRQPPVFKVFLDGKPIGQLDKIVEEKKEVALNIAMASTGASPRKAEEEVATQISGTIELPTGKHRLRLVHTQIVDGMLTRIRLGMTPEAANTREAEIKAAETAKGKK